MIVAVAANVADRSTVVLEHFVDMLGQCFPTFFSKRWNRNTNQATVVGGVEPEIRCANRLLNGPDKRGVIGLNRDQRCIRSSHLCDLIDRSGSTVIIDLNTIEN